MEQKLQVQTVELASILLQLAQWHFSEENVLFKIDQECQLVWHISVNVYNKKWRKEETQNLIETCLHYDHITIPTDISTVKTPVKTTFTDTFQYTYPLGGVCNDWDYAQEEASCFELECLSF